MMKEDKTEAIIDEAAAVASQKTGRKGVGTASCLGIFLGGGLGLLLAVVLVAGMWLLLLGMLVAAPPLEFMDRIETFTNGALTVSVALLLGLPLLGGVVGGTASASMVALWHKIRERPQPAPPSEANLPAPTAVVPPPAPLYEAEATAVPAVPPPPLKAEPSLARSRHPSPAGLLVRSIAIWLALFLTAFVVGLVVLTALAPAQPEESGTAWLVFLTVLLAGHALATYLAFASLLPGVGLPGWWLGRQPIGATAVAPIVPAFFLGTAVFLFVTLAAFFVGGLLRENASLSGIVMVLGMLLALVSGGLLAWVGYRRNPA
jgi:hypothetical protein